MIVGHNAGVFVCTVSFFFLLGVLPSSVANVTAANDISLIC